MDAERREPTSTSSSTLAPASDVGLTHVALVVRDVERSARFYARFAGMEIVHHRETSSGCVAWLSDLRRPFAVVLLESEHVEGRLEGVAHLGVGCASRAEVDELCELARELGHLEMGPEDGGAPMGYWALLRDPDGHNLEIAHGQSVDATVAAARSQRELTPRSDPPGPSFV